MITPITTTNVASLLPKLSEADQKKFDTVKANLQSALDTLKSSKVDAGAQRRAAAAARIAQIKQSIKSLRQLHGLDAKSLARLVAQLAKELASAVKDYQAAGGSDNSVTSGNSSTPVTASGDNNAASAPKPTDATTATNAYAQTQQATAPTGNDAQDQQFLKDVHEIENDLKSFSKQLRNSIKSRFMPENLDPDMKDVRAIDSALDEVDRSVSAIAK